MAAYPDSSVCGPDACGSEQVTITAPGETPITGIYARQATLDLKDVMGGIQYGINPTDQLWNVWITGTLTVDHLLTRNTTLTDAGGTVWRVITASVRGDNYQARLICRKNN